MKNNILSRLATTLLLSAATVCAIAQTTVSGLVVDPDDEPLIGATVQVKGASINAVADFDGKFTLRSVPTGATIVVSYVGYNTQEQTAAPQMTFVLEENTAMLDEVVVVGYGTMKKSNISGAVSSVKADDLPTAGNASVGEMLRGRAAGMNITSSTAFPGGQMNISIRGGLSGQKPLVVIDGVPQAPHSNVSSGTIYGGAQKDDTGRHDLTDLQLKLNLPDESLAIPASGGFTLPKNASAILPFNFDMDGITLKNPLAGGSQYVGACNCRSK